MMMIPRWVLTRLTSTLAAWLVAFLTVMGLLTLLDAELGSLPLALRAMVISGVLVFLMANLVMPIVNSTVARWLGSPAQEHSAGPGGSHIGRGDP
jgi:antibiotic biosynthesis monooxygenase (ABM) superfamily enzyme